MTASVEANSANADLGDTTASPPPDLLAAFLAGRDAPCPNCEYNLRDLPGGRCPECGLELVLRIQLAEPRQAAFLTGLVGLSAGAGFNALLFLYWLMMMWRFGWRGGNESFIAVVLIGLAVLAAAMWLWLRSRARLRTLPPPARWGLVAGCWALTLASLLAFTYSVR